MNSAEKWSLYKGIYATPSDEDGQGKSGGPC